MASPRRGHRLKWQKPSPIGGPSAAQLLLQWFEGDYSAYTRSPNKEKFLEGLRKTIEDAGHEGCTLRSVRSKVESLERQMKGQQTASRVLKENRELFERVFRGVGTKAPVGGTAAADESDSESEAEAVNSTLEGGDVSLEVKDADTSEKAKSGSIKASVAKRKDEGGVQAISAHDDDFPVTKRVKCADASCFSGKLEVLGDEDHVDKLAQSSSPPNARCRQVAPIRIPSKEEIERIATLLRERHQLQQIGVPQTEIDRYLPLPDE